ncbi:MAG TPA: DinB family protein [Microlunatus sp.]|nr:DinB family protein [Microlunatus sp.]
MDWTTSLAEQLSWHWEAQARPRLDGLTDDEYFWEPVSGCWSVRPRAEAVAMPVGVGDFIIDFAIPEPDPAPVTTIAWRLGHIVVGVLGERNARYFDGPAMSYPDVDYPGTADGALSLLDEGYRRWIAGVRGLDEARLTAACGEPGYEDSPMADLVLHIHREMIHHLAEIALLRDLYAAGSGD